MNIHPTAIVHPKAELADDVTVGPYTIIEEHVTLGKGCVVGNHCLLTGYTRIGENNRIYTGAVIGEIPQDLKYKGEEGRLEIGDDNNFREYVTVHIGTTGGRMTTRIGNRVHMMAYCHVAHDCIVHDGAIIANNGTLGGHVEIGEGAIVGGLSAVHQFVRIGKLAIVGGCSKAVQDILPFVMANGSPARVYGLNLVGLKRAGLPKETQHHLKQALRILFESALSREEALKEIERQYGRTPEVKMLIDFVRSSKRGVSVRVRHRRPAAIPEKEALWSDLD